MRGIMLSPNLKTRFCHRKVKDNPGWQLPRRLVSRNRAGFLKLQWDRRRETSTCDLRRLHHLKEGACVMQCVAVEVLSRDFLHRLEQHLQNVVAAKQNALRVH